MYGSGDDDCRTKYYRGNEDRQRHRHQPDGAHQRREDAAALNAEIKASGQNFTVKPWDWAMYADKLKAKKYAIDEDAVKPYFELRRVLEDGVFFMSNRLYGLSFKQRIDLPVYNPDVWVYDVFEEDGSQLGIFYFDPFQRDNKRGGHMPGAVHVEVGERELGVDGLDVGHRVHLAGHVHHVRILEAAHHVRDGVGLADVRQAADPRHGALQPERQRRRRSGSERLPRTRIAPPSTETSPDPTTATLALSAKPSRRRTRARRCSSTSARIASPNSAGRLLPRTTVPPSPAWGAPVRKGPGLPRGRRL